MPSVVLPPTYRGENSQYPEISIQSPFCARMENFNNKKQSVNVRNGISRVLKISGEIPMAVASYGSSTIFTLTWEESGVSDTINFYNTNGSLAHTASAGSLISTSEVATLTFRGYLMWFFTSGSFVSGSLNQVFYNGSTWGSLASYAYSGNWIAFGGNVYKNRAYFINRHSGTSGCVYGYTEIDAISGTVAQVDLRSVVSSACSLYIIRTISTTEATTQEAVQAFIFSNGEVLVYGGSYPDSPNWALISRFQISKPIYYNSFVDAQGDSFILTESEILSLRNLFITGYQQEKSQGIGSLINNRWRQIIKALVLDQPSSSYKFRIKGVYDEVDNRLIISLPIYVDPDTAATSQRPFRLVYDFNLSGWYEEFTGEEANITINNSIGTAYAGGKVYTVNYVKPSTVDYAVLISWDTETDFLDDTLDQDSTQGIPYKLRTAPLPINKYGASAISGVEAICKSDLYPQTNYKFIADLGRQSSGNQAIPAQGTDVAKPMMNVGIQGATTAQLEISGTSVSASVGLELYGFNVWFSEGAPGSR